MTDSRHAEPVSARKTRRADILEAAATLFAASGVRTSLKDIADACGILPGSMYYHFESKEALIVQLVRRYRADLDCIALQARETVNTPDSRPLQDRVIELGREIASCANRHPAALLMTLFEPPTGASEELQQLVERTPAAIHLAMLDVLRADQGHGALRPGIDLTMLADRLCESMIRHAVTVADFHLGPEASPLPDLRCRILLDGLAVEAPDKAALDRSDALRSVNAAVAHWHPCEADSERATQLLVMARTEFARRGYEVATLREIAAASGFGSGSVYRLFSSKAKMLDAIMGSFERQRKAAWDSVMHSSSTALEKLDALAWLHIMLSEKFGDEIRIQFGFVRESPLNTRRIAEPSRLRDIERLLAEGAGAGEIRLHQLPLNMYARCVYEALWTPEPVLRSAGAEQAHALSRDTMLSGALIRS
ncbi:transcriptional regulator, TetR family [Sphingomonas sp. YR710]|uniref:TetR/AcrR family transcriptional regulator n=1 Tax=Sphingomonas sp. YR710 TaxID=1882773 RepID=UPI00088555A3|nr:TetR family transcriptional regulator [Sphingomonas sp. YR710]SDD62421.1 transcriptional regulator, TetR family [Sphingomonas sp. YR710]